MDPILRRIFAGLRWLLVGAAVSALFVGGAVALSTSTDSRWHDQRTVALFPPDHDLVLTAAPAIDRQQAIDKALGALPGSTLISAELDADQGTTVWEVELRAPDGIEYEVTIDSNTGAVLGKAHQD
ncbi:PepSY domain-containing protein [Nocardia sp. NPDC051463]|uniref:PepSY domain-containing protein n=1 Tax=Nocardia sp. NPDC051463 TaxID=3154845 RepID=UPI003413F193